jgi:hypothetical protein
MAWRENSRRVSDGEQYLITTLSLTRCLVMKGYWQKRLPR